MVSPEEAAGPFLTDKQNAQLFNQLIRPAITGTPREDPQAIFIAGQPGAGKTSLQSAFLEILGRQDAFPLDGDDLLAQHPQYAPLSREDDLTAALIVGEDLRGRWWTRAARLVRAQQLDVVISAPLGGEEWAEARFRDFQNRNYRLVGAFVAVHEATSLQGMIYRLHDARRPERQGYGRFPPVQAHDDAYAGVLETADQFDRLGQAVYVLGRGPAVLHTNERTENGGRELEVSTRQVISAERARAWTEQESADFLQRQGELRASMGPEWRDLLDQVDQRAADVISPLTLLDDAQLLQYQRQVTDAVSQTRRLAEQAGEQQRELAERYRSGQNAQWIGELRQAGASPEDLARAVTSLREDRMHAGIQARDHSQRLRQLGRLQEGVQQEAARRTSLNPKQISFEHQGRQQHQALRPASAQIRLPQAGTLRQDGPSRKGRSL